MPDEARIARIRLLWAWVLASSLVLAACSGGEATSVAPSVTSDGIEYPVNCQPRLDDSILGEKIEVVDPTSRRTEGRTIEGFAKEEVIALNGSCEAPGWFPSFAISLHRCKRVAEILLELGVPESRIPWEDLDDPC